MKYLIVNTRLLFLVLTIAFPINSFSQLVGAMAGTPDVSPSGAFTYSIPIALPPGISGVMPQISLNYNSMAGNGPVGCGWYVSGLSAITRSSSDIYHNADVDPIDFDGSDVFMLDGSRLIPTGTSGPITTYETRLKSFSRITSVSGGSDPDHFIVEKNDGMTYEYGKIAGTRISIPLAGSTPSMYAGRSYVWLLNRMYDKGGNYVDYIYNNDPTSGEYQISQIKYTGNIFLFAPTTEIHFQYTPRTDRSFANIAGANIHSDYLLNQITVNYSGTTVHKYDLTYALDHYSHLSTVTETGESGSILPITKLTYGGPTATHAPVTTSVAYDWGYVPTVADFNGDGMSDFYYISANTALISGAIMPPPGFPSPPPHYKMFINTHADDFSFVSDDPLPNPAGLSYFNNTIYNYNADRTSIIKIDYNGDGKEDLLTIAYNTTGDYYIYLNLANAAGTGLGPVTTLLTCSSGVAGSGAAFQSRETHVAVGDFVGNGKKQVMVFYPLTVAPPANSRPYITYLIGDGFIQAGSHIGHVVHFTAMDYDGDGRDELYTSTAGSYSPYGWSNKIYSVQSVGTTATPSTGTLTLNEISFTGYPNKEHRTFFGDFNGDGKTDVLTWTPFPNTWHMGYAKGSEGFDIVDLTALGIGLNNNDPQASNTDDNYKIADFNGDGKDDILEMYLSGASGTDRMFRIFYSRGNNDFEVEVMNVTSDITDINDLSFSIGDFNGDGQADLMKFGVFTSTTNIQLFYFHKDDKRHLLHRIEKNDNITPTDGQTITVSYVPLPQDLSYQHCSSVPAYPFCEVVSGSIKVANKFQNSRLSLTNLISYGGYVIQKTGLGSRGFERTKTTSADALTSISTTIYSSFDQFSFETTVPVEIRTGASGTLASTVSGGAALFRKTLTYGQDILPSSVHLIYPKKEILEDYTNNLHTETDYIYNGSGVFPSLHNYGKPDKITVSKGYGLEVTDQEFFYSTSAPEFFNEDEPARIITTTTRSGFPSYSRTTDLTYTPEGMIKQKIIDPGTTNANTIDYTYDIFRHLVTETSSVGSMPSITNNYYYDVTNRFVEISSNTISDQERWTYDVWGNQLSYQDINGLVTNNTYDDIGRLLTSIDPSGVTTVTNYHWANALTTDCPTGIYNLAIEVTTLGISGSKFLFTDYSGNVVRKVHHGFNGNKIYTDLEYDARGNIIRQSLPYFTTSTPVYTTYTYDANGRKLSETDGTTAIGYGYLSSSAGSGSYGGMVIRSSNMSTSPSRDRETTVDASGAVTQVIDCGTSTLKYEYLSNGKLGTTSANGIVTAYTYDAYGNLASENAPNKNTTVYTYDGRHRPLTKMDANGTTWTYTYDILGRVTGKSDGALSSFFYTYGTAVPEKGQLTMATGPDAMTTTIYQFDLLSRLSSKTELVSGSTYTNSYTYDGLNRLNTITYPFGNTVQNEYTPHGYHSGIWAMGFAPSATPPDVPIWQKKDENAMGQTTKFTLGRDFSVIVPVGGTTTGGGSGTPPIPPLYTHVSTYNANGFLTSSNLSSPYTVFKDLSYTFDEPTGDLHSITDILGSRSENFTYDNMDRLTSYAHSGTLIAPAAESLDYNDNGNILRKSDISAHSWHYDKYAVLGLPYATSTVPTFVQTATYNSFDKVATLNEDNKDLEFSYNALEQRNVMKHYTGGVLDKTRHYAENYEETTDNITGVTTKVSYVVAEGKPVAMFVRVGILTELKYLSTDYLGSITHVLHASGSVDEERSYDAWGRSRDPNTWSYSGLPAYIFDRGYTGQEHLPDFNIINLNGRLYDPIIGRMFSVDPYIADGSNAQTYNGYSYANNNPLKYTDPSGNIAGAAAFFAISFGADYLSNVICGWDNPGKLAYSNATAAVNGVNNAMRVTLYKDDNTNLTFGLSPLNVGVSINGTYQKGNFSASGTAGIGLFGWYGGTGANYKAGDFNFGISAGFDGGHAPVLSGMASYKGYTAGISHYGGKDAQWNWIAGYQKGDFSILTSNDVGLGGDKFRTAALEVGVGPASFGFSLYTTDHEKNNGKGSDDTYKSMWGANPKGTYKTGSRVFAKAYFGYNDGFTRSRFGYDGGAVQDFIQNGIHRGLTHNPYFNSTLGPPGRIFGDTYWQNPYSLY